MKVILISGKQGSGKSTLGKALHTYLTKNKHNAFYMKFADPLYEMHAAIKEVAEEYGIPFEKKEGVLLQLLGTEWGRKVKGADVWVNACVHAVAEASMHHPGAVFIIDDCRFPNELTAFGPESISIRLHASEEARKVRADGWRNSTNHESETALDAAIFDYMLNTEILTKTLVAEKVIEYLEAKWGFSSLKT